MLPNLQNTFKNSMDSFQIDDFDDVPSAEFDKFCQIVEEAKINRRKRKASSPIKHELIKKMMFIVNIGNYEHKYIQTDEIAVPEVNTNVSGKKSQPNKSRTSNIKVNWNDNIYKEANIHLQNKSVNEVSKLYRFRIPLRTLYAWKTNKGSERNNNKGKKRS